MSMENLLIILLPSGIFFIWGGWLLWKHQRQRQRQKTCTEPVTAEIIAVKCIKLRKTTRYRYTVRYLWNGEAYTAKFRTTDPCGEQGDQIEIRIDPQRPQNMHADFANLAELADLILGCVLIVISLFCLVEQLFWE